MWRPKDWENPYKDYWHSAYEAGADAMLEALEKIREPAKHSWIVSLPDKELDEAS